MALAGARMKAAVIVFPGSNCDRDVKIALEASSGETPAMVWHGDGTLPDCDLIVLPGGFSYGDYLRTGAVARFARVMESVHAAAARGGHFTEREKARIDQLAGFTHSAGRRKAEDEIRRGRSCH